MGRRGVRREERKGILLRVIPSSFSGTAETQTRQRKKDDDDEDGGRHD